MPQNEGLFLHLINIHRSIIWQSVRPFVVEVVIGPRSQGLTLGAAIMNYIPYYRLTYVPDDRIIFELDVTFQKHHTHALGGWKRFLALNTSPLFLSFEFGVGMTLA